MISSVISNRIQLNFITVSLVSFMISLCTMAKEKNPTTGGLDACNVVWDTPSINYFGSMPLGNGDIGLNAWVNECGDLFFYISKTDSWDDNGRLLKIGSVRVKLNPSPIITKTTFTQTLHLADATMNVHIGTGDKRTAIRLWVDANYPVVHVEVNSAQPVEAIASIEMWRINAYTLPGLECSDVMNQDPQHRLTIVEPDTLLNNQPDRIGWYHHNSKSAGPSITAEIQGVKDFPRPDALLHRTFGAIIKADKGCRIDDQHLLSPNATTHRLSIHVLTQHPATPQEWLKTMDRTIAKTDRISFEKRRKAHEQWWQEFWNRSWIHVTSNTEEKKQELIPTNSHPLRIGIDQSGGNRYQGEFGRVSIFQTGLTDADVQRLVGLDRTQVVKEDKNGLFYSAIPQGPATFEDLKTCTFKNGLTFEAWIKPGKLPTGGARIFDKITPGGSDGILFDTFPGNSLRLFVGKINLNKKDILPADQWSHVAVVVPPEGDRIKLYLNGKILADHDISLTLLDNACVVNRAYALQRFINAGAGRGQYPIKFNGSIFTVPYPGKPGDADYRRWGPGYWWQNTRLPYISMCSSGDFDLIQPLFKMYGRDLMPLLRHKTKLYLSHEGAYIPECIYFWGDMFSETYGWTPCEQRQDKIQASGWHKWEWVSGPELVFMMLDYYDHTLDKKFLREMVLPTAHEILTFFDQQYKTDETGKMVMFPSQACETWWSCTNAMPELAGLHAVTDRLLALPEKMTTAKQRTFWSALQKKLPDLPTREVNGKCMLAPAAKFGHKSNCENPELYAVFPFRRIAVGRPNIELGIEALNARSDRGNSGWRQDDIFMAYLGLAEETRKALVGRAKNKNSESRFPAFWGPNYDWTPDQDHGSVLLKTLQAMIIQTDGKKIYLLPAWPKDWNLNFKLNAPYKTVITGTVEKGVLTKLDVQPASRKADVVIMQAQ